MSSIRYSTQYKKDIKNLSINEVNLVNELIKKLVNKECLEPKYKDHALIGDYKDFRECHVKANLLLIYRHFGDELLLARIGSHQALFKKYYVSNFKKIKKF